MNTDHAPTPEFLAHLEWEVLRTARREARFSAPVRRRSFGLRTLAIAIGCLALGVAGNLASAQVSGSARRDSLTQATMLDLSLLQSQLELARAELKLANTKVSTGVLARADLAATQAMVRAMELKAARLQLNLDEIQKSALPPRDDLAAPRVDGRDYVRERLAIDIADAKARNFAKEQQLSTIVERVNAGAVSDVARFEALLDVTHAQADVMRLIAREAARRDYLEQGKSAEETARRVQEVDMKAEMQIAQGALDLARRRLDVIGKQRAAGGASELDLLRAQVQIKEQELEVARITEQMKRLGKRP